MSRLWQSWPFICIGLFSGLPGFSSDSALFGQTSAPLPIQHESHREMIDGIHSEWLALSGQNFNARRFPGGNWYLADEAAPGASLTFEHRFLPDLKMDFSAYRSTALISDFSAREIRSYLAKEQKNYAKAGLTIRGARAEKAPVGSMPFMGTTYWKVTYSVIDKAKNEKKYAIIDYVTVSDDQMNFRLRFRGAPGAFEKQALATDQELSRFTLN